MSSPKEARSPRRCTRTGGPVIYDQKGVPLFQNKVYATRAEALRAPIGDVTLVQAPSGLVHNSSFDSSLLTYDTDYQNEQACSPTFLGHLDDVMALLRATMPVAMPGAEVGCGKGFFLELLNQSGFDVVGFDPAYEGTNPRVRREYFTGKAMKPRPAYVLLRHVLEHIQDPWAFLDVLSNSCAPGTLIYIEVPCFDWIVGRNAFYDVFYEHVNYFTLDVLANAFGDVRAAGRFFGEQYLYIVADLSTFRPPAGELVRTFEPIDATSHVDALLTRARRPLEEALVWGAGAKGITFANVFARRGHCIRALIDINPVKQGRFAGLSGVPILAPTSAHSWLSRADVFVMNPMYLREVMAMVPGESINWIPVA